MKKVRIGNKDVGGNAPVFIVAEVGINHNGDLNLAKRLIDIAAASGCDAVKFQKRTPEICVPAAEREKMRDTPWGRISYMDYRQRVEFGADAYEEIDRHCREHGIAWTASCWDVPSIDFIERFSPAFHKIASACLTDEVLLARLRATGRPIVLSTGMSTLAEIRRAVDFLGMERLIICHSTSTYPCSVDELNLRMIPALAEMFDCPIGYSGHEVGLQTTYAAVTLGACLLERHITLDRNTWGSDQASSVEPTGLFRMVRDIRVIQRSMGDGVKKVYESELPVRARLRRDDIGG